ncbi:MAG TPA: ArsC family reductase [Flavipsychrobacter sp.]|nr:ArsC family reductase [Flavipsychrobacter sp.]
MITLYGIKNCDIMQKAFKWLDAKGVPYRFHDYRADGLDRATIEHWLKHLPLDKLLNSRSTTFRELPEADKAAATNKARAIALMLEHNSIIKRPVWDLGKGKFFLGWDEKEISKLV